MLINKQPIGTVAYMGGTPAVLEKFTWAWTQLLLYSNEYLCTKNSYIHYDRSRVSDHAKARNELVQAMKGNWILMLDTDHEPDPDLLARMLNIFNKYKLQVLVGLYQIKMYPYPPLIYEWNEDHTEFEIISSFDNPSNVDIFEIAAAGGGCLLIHREVIYKMVTEMRVMPFDHMIHPTNKRALSEDLSFFRRCADLNIKCYASTKIENPHLDIVPITMEANVKADKIGMETEQKVIGGVGSQILITDHLKKQGYTNGTAVYTKEGEQNPQP
jgi:hypothetical protein